MPTDRDPLAEGWYERGTRMSNEADAHKDDEPLVDALGDIHAVVLGRGASLAYRRAAAQAIARRLDAAGYEVRPKLTAERLAVAMWAADQDPKRPSYPTVEQEAVLILAALDDAP